MATHLTDEGQWASAVAARLRLIQANFADDPPATRQNYLSEELEQSLRPLPPSRRASHLQALAEHFPAWGGGGGPAPVMAPAPAPASAPPAESTPEQSLEALLQAAPKLRPDEKAEFSRRLQEAGFNLPGSGGTVGGEVAAELAKLLAVPEGKELNLPRLQKMLYIVSSVYLALDQLVWALWKQLNPKSFYRREADWTKLTGPYVVGDPEVSTEQMRQAAERTRRLCAALLGAVGRSGSNFARKHSSDLSPEAIEGAARNEKKAWESLEAVSWRKYSKELYRAYAADQVIESQLQQELVRAAEELLKGIGR